MSINAALLLLHNHSTQASYDGLGDRILVSMKIVDVNTGQVTKNVIEQFENQVRELNRITDVMIGVLS